MPTTIAPVSERPNGAATASSTDSRLEIAATRSRQTERPPAPFRDVLAGGVSLLMSGAEVATHVVAGPVMAAAVHDARIGAASSISGSPGSFGSPGSAFEPAGIGAAVLPPVGGGVGASGTPTSVQSAEIVSASRRNVQLVARGLQVTFAAAPAGSAHSRAFLVSLRRRVR